MRAGETGELLLACLQELLTPAPDDQGLSFGRKVAEG